MKKSIIYILFISLVFSACDEGFEELNVNPQASAQIEPTSKLTAALLHTAGGRYENWRANLIYSSTMIQHFSATATYWSGDKYLWNRGYAASQFDRYYPSAVKTVEDILVQLREEAHPEEMISIARILRVLIYSKLTDLYGDIPYSEAGKGYTDGILKPKYDAQSAIYADMLNELEQSAAALGTGTSGFGGADVLFQGDQGKWKKFANSLMLRLALRMVKVDAAGAQAWATKAINGGVMTSNDDIAFIQHTDGPAGINRNGNGEVFLADGNMRMSKFFIDWLKAGNDPRLPVLAARRSDQSTATADLKGLPSGLNSDMLLALTGEANSNEYAEPNRAVLAGLDAPYFFQTYAEVSFMMAEAGERWGLGGDAATNYNNGVTAAMKMLGMYGAAGEISDGAISTYLSANPYNSANGIELINNQYWAATLLNDVESYANWRRTGFPVLTPTNYPGNETNGTIPRRLTYPTSEETSNPENFAAVVAAQGPDVLTTRMWWDQ